MAMAARVVMAESREIVPIGVIAPDAVMTPAVLVDHLIAREQQRNGRADGCQDLDRQAGGA
jgi:acyl CoA:acetate/3-ketoacid CoA transferase alpha subunit